MPTPNPTLGTDQRPTQLPGAEAPRTGRESIAPAAPGAHFGPSVRVLQGGLRQDSSPHRDLQLTKALLAREVSRSTFMNRDIGGAVAAFSRTTLGRPQFDDGGAPTIPGVENYRKAFDINSPKVKAEEIKRIVGRISERTPADDASRLKAFQKLETAVSLPLLSAVRSRMAEPGRGGFSPDALEAHMRIPEVRLKRAINGATLLEDRDGREMPYPVVVDTAVMEGHVDPDQPVQGTTTIYGFMKGSDVRTFAPMGDQMLLVGGIKWQAMDGSGRSSAVMRALDPEKTQILDWSTPERQAEVVTDLLRQGYRPILELPALRADLPESLRSRGVNVHVAEALVDLGREFAQMQDSAVDPARPTLEELTSGPNTKYFNTFVDAAVASGVDLESARGLVQETARTLVTLAALKGQYDYLMSVPHPDPVLYVKHETAAILREKNLTGEKAVIRQIQDILNDRSQEPTEGTFAYRSRLNANLEAIAKLASITRVDRQADNRVVEGPVFDQRDLDRLRGKATQAYEAVYGGLENKYRELASSVNNLSLNLDMLAVIHTYHRGRIDLAVARELEHFMVARLQTPIADRQGNPMTTQKVAQMEGLLREGLKQAQKAVPWIIEFKRVSLAALQAQDELNIWPNFTRLSYAYARNVDTTEFKGKPQYTVSAPSDPAGTIFAMRNKDGSYSASKVSKVVPVFGQPYMGLQSLGDNLKLEDLVKLRQQWSATNYRVEESSEPLVGSRLRSRDERGLLATDRGTAVREQEFSRDRAIALGFRLPILHGWPDPSRSGERQDFAVTSIDIANTPDSPLPPGEYRAMVMPGHIVPKYLTDLARDEASAVVALPGESKMTKADRLSQMLVSEMGLDAGNARQWASAFVDRRGNYHLRGMSFADGIDNYANIRTMAIQTLEAIEVSGAKARSERSLRGVDDPSVQAAAEGTRDAEIANARDLANQKQLRLQRDLEQMRIFADNYRNAEPGFIAFMPPGDGMAEAPWRLRAPSVDSMRDLLLDAYRDGWVGRYNGFYLNDEGEA